MIAQSPFKVAKASLIICALAVIGFAPGALASGGGGMAPSSSGGGGGQDLNAIYQHGVQSLNAHDYTRAISDFRTVQRAAPNNTTVNLALGLAYVGANDAEHARSPLERATRGNDAAPGAFAPLAQIYLQAGDRDHATQLQTHLNQMLTACDAACGDSKRAEIQAALTAVTQALAPTAPASAPTTGWNFPTQPEGRRDYAEAVGLINQQHYAEAFAALDRAEAAIGPHPDILNYKGFTSRRMGHLDDALGYYQQALALDPNHRGANEYLGELYLQMGRIDDARRQLARLDHLCAYGCAEREELQHWIEVASN